MNAPRWLSYRGVTELTSLSEATIRRLVAAHKFPEPMEATPGRRVFEEAAVVAAFQALLAERRKAPAPAAA